MNMDFGNRKIVISALVGSWASNLQTHKSDEDWKYFVSPTFDDLYTGKMFSSSNQSDEFDFDCHDIRQLGNLLWKSNLNFIITLFSPKVECDPVLQFIFDRADEFATMNMSYFCNSTFGMHFEKMSALNKGTAKTDILVSQFGYDTKQATHALRCLFILERVASGMSLRDAMWFEDGSAHREMLMDVKRGKFTQGEFESYVKVWHATNKENVKDYFSKFVANDNARNILDEGIKNFIRANM